jgi:hypothetical protein
MQIKVFDEINRNIMPKEVRKNEDVVELIESSNEKRIRHLILYGDCLVCCKTKRDKRHLKWFIPVDQLEIRLDEYKSDKCDNRLRSLREEVLSLRRRQAEDASARSQLKLKKKLAEQENELTIQSSRLKLIVRLNPQLATSFISSTTPSFMHTPLAAISLSMTNLTNLTSHKTSSSSSTSSSASNHHHFFASSNSAGSTHLAQSQNAGPTQFSTNPNSVGSNVSSYHVHTGANQYIILFTSDYERIAWLEEINGAIYACELNQDFCFPVWDKA